MDHPPVAGTGSPAVDCCSVVELRQYTLQPGGREVLIDLFDRHFREGLEAVGMHVLGEFRDLDDPDRFVWMRGFSGMESRAAALRAFYEESLVWKAHRDEANATMVDSDDVLLLRPVNARSGFRATAHGPARSLVVVTIYYLDGPVDEDFTTFFASRMTPLMASTGAEPLGCLVTEPAENAYPKLPVRTGENAFVWFSSFAGPEAHREHTDLLAGSGEWTGQVAPELIKRLNAEPQRLRLVPTATSRLR
ncbi:hypothetical protein FHR32_005519 [Streptosporangium album]|uniref:NIPSNAP family protein n=1 Tax=Streptosporangium album TaxID=47479 RepID=A0A7W7WB59_9ACTN|nr:NIPSNAP family protein [Streptosporangium album]MBB4941142.1 hypothetical protein [Streptosporangium album]